MWSAALFGGLGGSIRGLLAFYQLIGEWHQIRRQHLASHKQGPPDPLSQSIDWAAESIAMAAQVILGVLAGLILSETGTVTGVAGAILAGAAAPAILSQLGQAESVQNLVTSGQETKQQQRGDDTIGKGVACQTITPVTDAVLAGGNEVEQEEAPRAN